MPAPIHWHGQGGQDVLAWHTLGDKHGGYFVDLAANDPFQLSNTATLERSFGWKGLCIETLPKKVKALREKRSCQVVDAVVGTGAPVLFRQFSTNASTMPHFRWIHGLSHAIKEPLRAGLTVNHTCITDRRCYTSEQLTRVGVRVDEVYTPTVPLATLLRQHAAPRVIDYLSLDVEGAEDDVLLQFPFDEYLFRVMSIERPSDMLKKVLTERGYSRLAEPLKASAWGEEMWRATSSKILI